MRKPLERALDRVTGVRGVRGALLVSRDDGMVVAESVMEGIRGNAVAALAASLDKRFARAAGPAGLSAPRFVQLQADDGVLVMVAGPDGILLVTVADADVNVGLVRLEMLRASEAIG